MSYYGTVEFSVLKGKTLTEAKNDGDEIHFTDTEGNKYRMLHHQDCCESVYIESVTGDLNDLIGHEITLAEASSEEEGSTMWTFYKLATNKGYVDIRWNSDTNSYYSVSVDFEQLKGND